MLAEGVVHLQHVGMHMHWHACNRHEKVYRSDRRTPAEITKYSAKPGNGGEFRHTGVVSPIATGDDMEISWAKFSRYVAAAVCPRCFFFPPWILIVFGWLTASHLFIYSYIGITELIKFIGLLVNFNVIVHVQRYSVRTKLVQKLSSRLNALHSVNKSECKELTDCV